MLDCLCLQLTLHSVTGHTSEHLDLFCTVTSYTFHNLSPSTAYSATITAVNKGRSGPPVSVDVTTQGAPGDRAYIARCTSIQSSMHTYMQVWRIAMYV